MTNAILVLIFLLGHPNCSIRDQAERTLGTLGEIAYPILERSTINVKDPEIAMRAERILPKYSVPEDDDILFWMSIAGMVYIDSLNGLDNVSQYREKAERILQERNMPTGGPFYLEDKLAGKLWLEAGECTNILILGIMQIRTLHYEMRGCWPK